jgi:hypothetical protein
MSPASPQRAIISSLIMPDDGLCIQFLPMMHFWAVRVAETMP